MENSPKIFIKKPRVFYHLLHPVHGVKCVFRIIKSFVIRCLVDPVVQQLLKRQCKDIPRGRRERCWCDGKLSPFSLHSSYGVCQTCKGYVNLRPVPVNEMEKIYSLDFYWKSRQKLRRFPSIEDRGDYYEKDGRLDLWLGAISEYGPSKGKVVEVGCAPGILLSKLQDLGYDCTGVEASDDTACWIKRHYGLDVRKGLFPDVDLPKCDLFLAFDVLEHSADPLLFLRKAAELLSGNGVLIIQTCVNGDDHKYPFGNSFRNAFDEVEHLFLFNNRSMHKLAELSGFKIISPTEEMKGMAALCVMKKQIKREN